MHIKPPRRWFLYFFLMCMLLVCWRIKKACISEKSRRPTCPEESIRGKNHDFVWYVWFHCIVFSKRHASAIWASFTPCSGACHCALFALGTIWEFFTQSVLPYAGGAGGGPKGRWARSRPKLQFHTRTHEQIMLLQRGYQKPRNHRKHQKRNTQTDATSDAPENVRNVTPKPTRQVTLQKTSETWHQNRRNHNRNHNHNHNG